MSRLLPLLGVFIVLFPQATDGRLYVNGKPCVRGAGIMAVPRGMPRPEPCPPHVDAWGSCWRGDSGFDRERCIEMYGQEAYDNLPRAENRDDGLPPGLEIGPPGFVIRHPEPGVGVGAPGLEVAPPGFEAEPPGN